MVCMLHCGYCRRPQRRKFKKTTRTTGNAFGVVAPPAREMSPWLIPRPRWLAPHDFAFTQPSVTELSVRAQRSLFNWLLDSMMAARMRDAERDVEHYLADIGGKLTDDAEREIERRYVYGSSSW